jgi:phosphoserine phosphatase RsbU/P
MALAAPQVWLFDSDPQRSDALREELVRRGIRAESAPTAPRMGSGARPSLAVLSAGSGASEAELAQLRESLKTLRESNVPALIWGPALGASDTECMPAETSLDEIVGRLSTMVRYVPIVRKLDSELRHMQRLSSQLSKHFEELDKEMRLAGRLQREFIPKPTLKIPGLSVSFIYRPATFVSGDIFDAIPIDERHVGLFIADAMGHGTAAGMMTMFVRRELLPTNEAGAIVPPVQALEAVHEGLAQHKLSQSQFVTAAYAVLDTVSGEIDLARGGHPHPIWINAAGELRELRAEGGLMGLEELPPQFSSTREKILPDDKLILYSDGLENIFLERSDGPRDDAAPAAFSTVLREWATLSAAEIVAAVEAHLDQSEGSLNPDDDITLLVVQRDP